ncbi:MAG: hypothetical protein AUI54_02935 [Acidobacteria bacterium 13_1_40CM_2_56_5]|nr:MAG: hypothetical protein AUI54_02935 [Acidobacteria bacterium 13_1_40CM_2_56_5]
MRKKQLVSLAMEGKFCRDGLQALEEDDDMLTAMARELVTEKGIGESAAAVWRQIQAEHNHVVAPTIIMPETAPVIEVEPRTTPPITPVPSIPAAPNALKFGSRPPTANPVRQKEVLPADAQLPLF